MEQKINQINAQESSVKSSDLVFQKGQKINIELADGSKSERTIVNVLDSRKAASAVGLTFDIKNPVPVLILDQPISGRAAAHYHPGLNVIFAYNDNRPEVMAHEIVHSLEMQKPLSSELEDFYQKVLREIPDTTNLEPNFRKNIHEFIADAYSKAGLIENLKKHGLYVEFEKLTKYIYLSSTYYSLTF